MTLAELLVTFGVDVSAVDDGLAHMNESIKQASDNAVNSWDGFKRMGDTLTQAGLGLTAAITAPLIGVGGAALEAAGKLEVAKVAFTTMTKSASDANMILNQIRDFAQSTPFQFEDLVAASRKMMALGFAAKDVIPTLRIVGDAVGALGLGAEGIDRVIVALGQMQAKGTAQAEEMRQLAEAGIPAWGALAQYLGVTIPEAMKLVEQRAVSATTAIDAVLTTMQQKFGGGMAAQAQTFIGMVSNVKDEIGRAHV